MANTFENKEMTWECNGKLEYFLKGNEKHEVSTQGSRRLLKEKQV